MKIHRLVPKRIISRHRQLENCFSFAWAMDSSILGLFGGFQLHLLASTTKFGNFPCLALL